MPFRPRHELSKHRPRGFESLETRCALDGAGLALTSLPAVTLPTSSLRGVSVYAAPIGPAPASPAPASPTQAIASGSAAPILQPIPAAYLQRLNFAALPIGPARPATLPSQQQTPPVAIPPAAAQTPLYAEGFLPTNQTPANLPTSQQSMPVVPSTPGVPNFSLVPGRPLY